MAKIPALDAVRIIPRDADFLSRRSGNRGEIFFDRSTNTLRLFDGQTQGGTTLAKSDLSNVTNAAFLAKATASGVGGGGGGGNTTVTVSDEIPANAEDGNLWLNTNNGILYVYIDDGDSEQWIQPAAPIPSLATVATSGDYDDLSNVPDLSLYALSSSLSNYALSSSLSNYATLTYVDNAISSLPPATTESFSFSVAADDSTQRAISSGNLIKFIGAGGLTTSSDADGNITITGGGSTGNVTFNTTTIDTTDSSAITFTPAVIFNSDITVDNDIFVSNNLFSTTSIDTPKITSPSSILALQSSSIVLDGLATFYKSTEVINTKTGATGTVIHDFSTGAIWYHSSLAANFTANFINVPTTNDRTINVVLVLIQGATARIPNVLEINGSAQTINWQDNVIPSGNNNKRDIVSFSLIRTSNNWLVLGSLSTYG